MSRSHPPLFLSTALFLALMPSGCADVHEGPKLGLEDAGMSSPQIDDVRTSSPQTEDDCEPGPVTCSGPIANACIGGTLQTTDCSNDGDLCVFGIGCARCTPGRGRCDGEITQQCSEEGDRWVSGEVCSGLGGVHCGNGECRQLCFDAAVAKDYLGCEYWAVTTPNSVNHEFEFAIVLNNPQSMAADVHISAAQDDSEEGSEDDAVPEFSRDERVEAGTIKVVKLPWRGDATGAAFRYAMSAYRIVSSVPIGAFQFNPLEYMFSHDCADPNYDSKPGNGSCYSYSNDASLLLPTATHRDEYMVLSVPAGTSKAWYTDPSGDTLPGSDGRLHDYESRYSSFTMVGVKDETTVTIVPSTTLDSSAGIFRAGAAMELHLNAGQTETVFAISTPEDFCPQTTDNDFYNYSCGTNVTCKAHRSYCKGDDPSGTRITSSHPIAVLTGSPCAFVPYNRYACDHLEETLPALQTWGTEAVVGLTHSLYGEPNIVRVISAADNNTLTFEPSAISSTRTLDAGEVLEISMSESFHVKGTQPLLVGQFLVGQNYDGAQAGSDRANANITRSGDPSLTFVAPVEQWRREYDFLTPDTYSEAWVTVTGPSHAVVSLDGAELNRSTAIDGTSYVTFEKKVAAGAHTIRAQVGVGVQVYGFGQFTSYMFPAGLDLQVVNDLY